MQASYTNFLSYTAIAMTTIDQNLSETLTYWNSLSSAQALLELCLEQHNKYYEAGNAGHERVSQLLGQYLSLSSCFLSEGKAAHEDLQRSLERLKKQYFKLGEIFD